MARFIATLIVVLLSLNSTITWAAPLKVDPNNRRYFTDGSGKVIYLTGSHTWNNLIDLDGTLDWGAHLNFLQNHNHNFIRLWLWEGLASYGSPTIYNRSGPGTALDGKLCYDLNQINPQFLTRLRNRVHDAALRGMYVSVMLFNWYNINRSPAFDFSPYRSGNNINGISADLNGDGLGTEMYIAPSSAIDSLQKNYVRQVIDAVNDLDNVLFEICNECRPESISWQSGIVNYIHTYENTTKPKQHPVGMTSAGGCCNDTSALFASPADFISPDTLQYDFANNPPPADGRKVIVADTDHIFGVGGDQIWVWKNFTRGINPIYMDPLNDFGSQRSFVTAEWNTTAYNESARIAMGQTRAYADKMNLAAMVPRGHLCSSGYCLANPGWEYIVFLSGGGSTTVNLSGGAPSFSVEWFNPVTNSTQTGAAVSAGNSVTLNAPFSGPAVLYLKATVQDAMPLHPLPPETTPR